MKKTSLFVMTAFMFSVAIFFSCSTNISSLPNKPKSVEEVKKSIAGKKYVTQETGFYGAITVNGKTEAEWIDIKNEKEKYAKEIAEEQAKFSLQFLTDTTATVFTSDTAYAASYVVDDLVDQYDEGKEGIKLRLTYVDPKFSFGSVEPMAITFTYFVDGIDDKSLLLQLPRDVNRRKVISLLRTE